MMTTTLAVADVEASLDWYRDSLGFVVDRVYRSGEAIAGVLLKAGTAQLMLTPRGSSGARGGEQPVALHFSTAQDIDALADRIKAAGGALAAEPAALPFGARAFRVRDPDGFLLTISSEQAPRPESALPTDAT
jgi:uncharacterized glyoxalase superfamily protein PhnB